MNANLDYYRMFYYVAKNESISETAKQLFVSQPAVSLSIKQLEKTLGCTLFLRTQKGVKLTPEGEMLFSYVSKGYETILLGERKLEEMLNFENGEIRIGASDMTLRYFLLPYLEKFHKNYPGIKITVSNAPTPETIDYLIDGKIDFGVVSSPVDESKDYNITPVSEIQDIFVAASRFDWLSRMTVQLSELAKLPTICLEKRTSTRRYVDEFFAKRGVQLNPEFELSTSELIVQFAEMDMGIGCIVKDFAKESLERGKLFELKLEEELPPRKLCIITGTHNSVSKAGQVLLDSII